MSAREALNHPWLIRAGDLKEISFPETHQTSFKKTARRLSRHKQIDWKMCHKRNWGQMPGTDSPSKGIILKWRHTNLNFMTPPPPTHPHTQWGQIEFFKHFYLGFCPTMHVTEKGTNLLGWGERGSQGSYFWNTTTSVPKSVPHNLSFSIWNDIFAGVWWRVGTKLD